MHGELILDPYLAPKMFRSSSCKSYSQGRLVTSWAPQRYPMPLKKLYLPKSYVDYNFCYQNFFVRPTLLGGPLVKISKSRKNQYYSPQKEGPNQKYLLTTVVVHMRFWQVKFFSEPYRRIRIQKSGFLDLRIRFSGFLDPDQSIGLTENFYLPKPYMGSNFCCQHILIGLLLLGAPLINVVLCSKAILDFWIRISPQGSEKNFTQQNPIWATTFITNFF